MFDTVDGQCQSFTQTVGRVLISAAT